MAGIRGIRQRDPAALVAARTGRGRSETELHYPKVARRDVPTQIEALASDDEEDRQNAIGALCPGPGRRYNFKAWEALLAGLSSHDPAIRIASSMATARLREHSISDPRATVMMERKEKSKEADGVNQR